MMKRREFIYLAGSAALADGAAATWPNTAIAQQAVMPIRIGFLPLGSPSNSYDQSLVVAFQKGLRNVGLIENQDVTIDVVWVSSEPEFPSAVSNLIQRGAKLLVTAGSSASAAAKRNTSAVPIVFVAVGNPIGIGLVETLAWPGGNATGFSDVLADLSSKYVDFAGQLGGAQAAVQYLWHTAWPDGQHRYKATEQAVQSVGKELRSRGITNIAEADDAFAALKSGGVKVIIIQPSPFTYRHRNQLIGSAQVQGLGVIFGWPQTGREGALIGYGPDYAYLYGEVGSYIVRILKGAKPADLPVQEPTKFALVINLKNAKALGLTVPSALLASADELIE
jgi:putative tryptophan/tyrosine transport system substrate-binding protein